MKEPLVSVIIPCYNAELYLKDAIQSIVDQTYKNLEILVIDDGCTDNSALIYNEFAQKDKRIKIEINETNIGLINTLNKGIDLASGEFIARMDADDLSSPDRINEQVSFMLKNKEISVLGTKAQLIDTNGQVSKSKSLYIYQAPDTINFTSYLTQPIVHGSVLARTEVLQENKYDLGFKYAEDFELWLRLVSKGYKLANLSQDLYYYRKNPDSVSNQNVLNQVKTHNKISKIYLEKKTGETIDDKTISIINNRPTEHITTDEFRKAIVFFNRIFPRKNARLNPELRKYKVRQITDICLQTAKASSTKTKLACLLTLSNLLLKREFYNYTLKKFI